MKTPQELKAITIECIKWHYDNITTASPEKAYEETVFIINRHGCSETEKQVIFRAVMSTGDSLDKFIESQFEPAESAMQRN